MKYKILKIFLTVLSVLVITISFLTGSMGLFFRLNNVNYFNASTAEFMIPGLNENFIPQGLEYDERTNNFFFGGYTNDSSSSRVYLVNKTTHKTKRVNLLNQKGSKFTSHFGGLKIRGNYVYVAGSSKGCLYIYSYQDFIDAKDNGEVKSIGSVSCKSENDKIRVSFVGEIDNYIVAGEYYDKSAFDTASNHKITLSDGTINGGIATFYEVDETMEFGIKTEPSFVLSLPDRVQGMTYYDNTLYLSISYGLEQSQIKAYDLSKVLVSGTINCLDSTYDLKILDDSSLIKTTYIAPMSEEIVIIDERLYVNQESASSNYIFGRTYGGGYIYSTPIDFFLK